MEEIKKQFIDRNQSCKTSYEILVGAALVFCPNYGSFSSFRRGSGNRRAGGHGGRGKPRTVQDSPVPIDVFGEEAIEDVAFTDMNDILDTCSVLWG